jgi:hypothetical protein
MADSSWRVEEIDPDEEMPDRIGEDAARVRTGIGDDKWDKGRLPTDDDVDPAGEA